MIFAKYFKIFKFFPIPGFETDEMFNMYVFHIKGYVFVNTNYNEYKKKFCMQMIYSSWLMTTDYSSGSPLFLSK